MSDGEDQQRPATIELEAITQQAEKRDEAREYQGLGVARQATRYGMGRMVTRKDEWSRKRTNVHAAD